MLKTRLKDDRMLDVAMNTPERFVVHNEILNNKPIMRGIFKEFHEHFLKLDQQYFGQSAGMRVELGAGIAPVRENFPEVLATDIVAVPHLDRVLNAQEMDLEANSVRAFYCQNSFHHFPDPQRFFSELMRTVNSGGGAIFIEPYYGPFSSFLYPRLFAEEAFDKKARDWAVDSNDSLSKPNQALSYLVFKRDKDLFAKHFPELEIVYMKPLTNYLRYLLSGGLNFRQLIPNYFEGAVKKLEMLLTPLAHVFALHHIVVVRKR